MIGTEPPKTRAGALIFPVCGSQVRLTVRDLGSHGKKFTGLRIEARFQEPFLACAQRGLFEATGKQFPESCLTPIAEVMVCPPGEGPSYLYAFTLAVGRRFSRSVQGRWYERTDLPENQMFPRAAEWLLKALEMGEKGEVLIVRILRHDIEGNPSIFFADEPRLPRTPKWDYRAPAPHSLL